ncbi:MAG: phosphoenolpyruvate carboxykinase (ATP) [Acidobacteria bacterium RIFCSPLOWO2_12_FULL_54_10]|nr:MAG: phosphoenolpyruvate carboxykinase (ATP) [Acidobacteria bacterium RIFCSPLOWO2_12_FULL_54_10]
MGQEGWNPSTYGLEEHGIQNVKSVYWNLPAGQLYEHAVRRSEALVAHHGALVVNTGRYTGRSPNDKFVVQDPSSDPYIWWGKVNRPFDAERFEHLQRRMQAYLQGRELYVQDCFVGADPSYRKPVRIVTELAWHSLFVRNMFVRPDWSKVHQHVPEYTIICAPNFKAVPDVDGTRSEAFILVNFGKKVVLIGGTSYAGEVKKSAFTIMNYCLPFENIFPMHCSANIGHDGDTAIFFGLSGTGKTTLSTDPDRRLIGDDEHGWSDHGVFNFEGGCYAKVIRLSKEAEPQIYETTRRFGTVLENVVIDPLTRRLNLDDDSVTENTRGCYPLTHIDNVERSGMGGHPKNVIFLTADAFGVMPPVSKLTPEQAMYHFLSGYTAKVAGTERGMGNEPQATFSTCFGAPFMAQQPSVYANLLRDKLAKHKADSWLVNTGWSGGPYGVGKRVPIAFTRAIIRAILNGKLAKVPTKPDPIFGLHIPETCEGVSTEILRPNLTWKNPADYDKKARELAQLFEKNFETFAATVSQEVCASGPKAG